MSTVTITANKEGKVFTQAINENGTPKLDKNNKPYGYIRVENEATINLEYAYKDGGIKRGNAALILMEKEAFEKVAKFYTVGTKINGRVRVIESLEKVGAAQEKKAGKDGPSLKLDGQVIYRRTEYTSKNEEDVLIAHNNHDEVKAYQEAVKASSSVIVSSATENVAN